VRQMKAFYSLFELAEHIAQVVTVYALVRNCVRADREEKGTKVRQTLTLYDAILYSRTLQYIYA
jgi:hypothetical protein